jgi:hypothetical protein
MTLTINSTDTQQLIESLVAHRNQLTRALNRLSSNFKRMAELQISIHNIDVLLSKLNTPNT